LFTFADRLNFIIC